MLRRMIGGSAQISLQARRHSCSPCIGESTVRLTTGSPSQCWPSSSYWPRRPCRCPTVGRNVAGSALRRSHSTPTDPVAGPAVRIGIVLELPEIVSHAGYHRPRPHFLDGLGVEITEDLKHRWIPCSRSRPGHHRAPTCSSRGSSRLTRSSSPSDGNTSVACNTISSQVHSHQRVSSCCKCPQILLKKKTLQFSAHRAWILPKH